MVDGGTHEVFAEAVATVVGFDGEGVEVVFAGVGLDC